jgi:hypothetical protein
MTYAEDGRRQNGRPRAHGQKRRREGGRGGPPEEGNHHPLPLGDVLVDQDAHRFSSPKDLEDCTHRVALPDHPIAAPLPSILPVPVVGDPVTLLVSAITPCAAAVTMTCWLTWPTCSVTSCLAGLPTDAVMPFTVVR